MVLDDGGDDDVVGLQPQPVGEVVDRLGGVAADDRDVVALVPAGEPQGRGAGRPRRRRWRCCDFQPAPRWTLEYHGRKSATRSATAGSAAVEAAASRER